MPPFLFMNIKDFNYDNIKNFVDGNFNMVKDIMSQNLQSHIKEQALYRAMLCWDCLKAGKCSVCHCKTPGMFYSPDKTDAKHRWHKMLPLEFWEEYKIIHNLDLNTTFKQIIDLKNKQDMKYFKPEEFSMGGVPVYDKMNGTFLAKLDELREKLNQPIKIISSFRDTAYNEGVGGVKSSYHLLGRAVDIACPTSEYRAAIIKVALNMGLTVGVMNTSLHIDDRTNQILFHYYPRYGKDNAENQFNG